MSVEACSFLRPSLKAKLQDSGVLYVADLYSVLAQCGVDSAAAAAVSSAQPHASPLSDNAVCDSRSSSSHSPRSTTGHHRAASATTAAPSQLPAHVLQQLQQRLPALTPRELAELVSVTATSTSTSACAPTHAGFTMRTLRDVCAAAALADGAMSAHVATRRTVVSSLHDDAAVAAAPRCVTTFARDLDALLGGGGVPACAVTELCGPPGAGKTQLLLQLAVNSVLPPSLGGLGGECVFVDTEGSFAAERLCQVAAATVAHVKDMSYRQAMTRQRATATATTAAVQRVTCKRERSPHTPRHANDDDDDDDSGVAATTTTTTRRAIVVHNVDTDEDSNGSNSSHAHATTTTTTSARVAAPTSSSPPSSPDYAACARYFTVDYVLRRVHYVRITDVTSLMAFLYALPDALAAPHDTSAVGHDGGSAHADDHKREAARENNNNNNNNNVHSDNNSDKSNDRGDGMLAPAWPPQQTRSGDHDAGNGSSSGSGSGGGRADLSRVKMLIIDSIAQPFRAFAALSSDAMHGSDASHAERERRERLWRRSRLLFACVQRLQAYAATLSLTVVVSNQVTSRLVYTSEAGDAATTTTSLPSTYNNARRSSGGYNNNNGGALRGRASWQQTSSVSSSSLRRVTVLVPALGDAWAYGLSTRLLLSFHHYAATPHRRGDGDGDNDGVTTSSSLQCNVENVTVCCMRHDDSGGNKRVVDNNGDDARARAIAVGDRVDDVQQHRVARLLKSTTAPRGECCFAITRRGIRDVRTLAAHALR